MRIAIAQRYRPFSHTPGVKAYIPGSPYVVQAFPTLWRLYDQGDLVREVEIPCQGPVQGFTLIQDLEAGRIKIFGQAQSGYFSLEISHIGDEISVRGPLKEDFTRIQVPKKASFKRPQERLSLGSHKSLEFETLAKRNDLKEILPLWFHLAQNTPNEAQEPCGGNFDWLKRAQEQLDKREKLSLKESLCHLFQSSFDPILMPKCQDDRFLGLTLSPYVSGAPRALLGAGYPLIKGLFCHMESSEWKFLPLLLGDFVSGRMQVEEKEGSALFEWTKSRMRQAIIKGKVSQEMALCFPSEIKNFRVRTSKQDRGRVMRNGDALFLEENKIFFLDRFEK